MELLGFDWKIVISIILGIYEVLVRFIPTVGTWSILSWIIKLLQWLSDMLDNRKK